MAKSKKRQANKYYVYGAILFAIASVCMIFLSAVKYQVSENVDPVFYTGLQVAFGYSETASSLGFTLSTEIFKFSIMSLLPYILVLGGAVLLVLSALGGDNKLFNFIAFAAFIVAAIFFFLAANFPVIAEKEALGIKAPVLNKEYLSIAIGSILSAVFAIVSAALLAVKALSK